MTTNKLSLFDATLMNMNIMIGGGIFAGPVMMALAAGNASFFAWPLAALIFLPLVVSFAQLMKLFPAGGGIFEYISNGLTKRIGLFGSWIYMFGYICVGSTMLICLYETVLKTLGASFLTHSPLLFYICTLTVVFTIVSAPVSAIGMIQSYCTIMKIMPLCVLIGFFFFQINTDFPITTPEIQALPQAVIPWALFGFLGFEACSSIAHLMENSKRDGLRALLIGFFSIVAIYTLFHFGLLQIMGTTALIEQGARAFPLFLNAPIIIKTLLDKIISIATIITFFASVLGITFGNTALYNLLVKEGVMRGPEWLYHTNRHNRPYPIAILQIITLLTVALVFTNKDLLANYANLFIFSAFIITFISLVKLNKIDKKWHAIIINILSIGIAGTLIAYSVYSMAPTILERLWLIAPLLGIASVGTLLYKNNMAKKA